MRALLQGYVGNDRLMDNIYRNLIDQNYEVEFTKEFDQVDPFKADLMVMTGFHKMNPYCAEVMKSQKKLCLVMDAGYIHRSEYCQVSMYRLNQLNPFDCRDDRWLKLGKTIKCVPDSSIRNRILVCGQIPGDAQHPFKSRRSITEYYTELYTRIRKVTQRPIHFRPHPGYRDTDLGLAYDDILSPDDTLESEIEKSWCVVTYNSGVGVEALLTGVPIFIDTSRYGNELPIYHTLANYDLRRIEDPWFPRDADRENFFHRLAYSQWTPEEWLDPQWLQMFQSILKKGLL